MKVIVVYNANENIKSAILDYAHKVFSPSTYRCELCSLTHSNIGPRKEWRSFRKSVNLVLDVMYIESFEERFNHRFNYPVILLEIQDNLEVIMTKDEIANHSSIESLLESLNSRLN